MDSVGGNTDQGLLIEAIYTHKYIYIYIYKYMYYMHYLYKYQAERKDVLVSYTDIHQL